MAGSADGAPLQQSASRRVHCRPPTPSRRGGGARHGSADGRSRSGQRPRRGRRGGLAEQWTADVARRSVVVAGERDETDERRRERLGSTEDCEVLARQVGRGTFADVIGRVVAASWYSAAASTARQVVSSSLRVVGSRGASVRRVSNASVGVPDGVVVARRVGVRLPQPVGGARSCGVAALGAAIRTRSWPRARITASRPASTSPPPRQPEFQGPVLRSRDEHVAEGRSRWSVPGRGSIAPLDPRQEAPATTPSP